MKKYLYIIDYWVPSRDGIINLIAENDTVAFTLLSDEESFDKEYQSNIMEKVISAQKFELTEDYQSTILEVFVL